MEKKLILVHFSAIIKINPTSFSQDIWDLRSCPCRKGRLKRERSYGGRRKEITQIS